MNLREKLTARMDEIQRIMEANEHLAEPEKDWELLKGRSVVHDDN